MTLPFFMNFHKKTRNDAQGKENTMFVTGKALKDTLRLVLFKLVAKEALCVQYSDL